MFFDDVSEIPEIARKVGTAIFVVPEVDAVAVPGAIVVEPEGRATITIDQVREMLAMLTTKQLTDRFVLIRPADKLGEEAENAILKGLEEPRERVHFALVTDSLSGLLPTIRSRAAIYVLRREGDDRMILADEKIKALAKELLVVKPDGVVVLVEKLTKKKDGVRAYVLAVLAVAVEMAYKSYLLTGKMVFVRKVEHLVAVYEAVALNGNIKLQIIAGLV